VPHSWRRQCWLRGSILMCSQLTLGSTQPGEKPVTVHSGNASSTWQHSIKGHATEERAIVLGPEKLVHIKRNYTDCRFLSGLPSQSRTWTRSCNARSLHYAFHYERVQRDQCNNVICSKKLSF